jgi:hypothetical protein
MVALAVKLRFRGIDFSSEEEERELFNLRE